MTQTTAKSNRNADAGAALDLYSPRMFRVFTSYLQGYFARNFDAVRLHKEASTDWPDDGPMVFFCNHAGWWDPIFILLLAGLMTPGRRAFGPMDEGMLRKYAFMKRIGLYGIDTDSMRGAAKFLAVSKGILSEPGTAIWMTPQGRFCDVRQRPLEFQAGIAHLARDTATLFVPVAFEYPFWNERKPEALVHFGEPLSSADIEGRNAEAWNHVLEERLEATMTELADAAVSRDADRFTTLIKGRARVNPVYDAWRYAKAMFRREKFSAAHQDDAR
jgi:1-acyl-sn-glycerol-3-phosphate acyltransferase